MTTITEERPVERPQRIRLAYLDGIRGFAAFYVVLYHAWIFAGGPSAFAFLRYGHYSVVAFIVLSGYSLMLPISQRRLDQLPNPADFARRRARRILPPYYAALALSILVGFLVPAIRNISTDPFDPSHNMWPPTHQFWRAVFTHLILIHNWFNNLGFRFNSPLWSVATEWQIYFLFPLVLLPVRKLWGGVAAVAAGLAFALFALIPQTFNACPWFVGSFALGMLASDISTTSLTWKRYALPVALGSAVIAVGCHFLRHFGFALQYIGSDIALSLLFASLLVYMMSAPESPLARFFSLKALTTLGEFSYSLYLVHMPLLLIRTAQCSSMTPGSRMFVAIAVAIPFILLIAYGFHQAFERPFMRWKNPV